MSGETWDVGALANDPGWRSGRKSAVEAPSATIVDALCDYAERRCAEHEAVVEARVREQVAQEIEDVLLDPSLPAMDQPSDMARGYASAARIARAGGSR